MKRNMNKKDCRYEKLLRALCDSCGLKLFVLEDSVEVCYKGNFGFQDVVRQYFSDQEHWNNINHSEIMERACKNILAFFSCRHSLLIKSMHIGQPNVNLNWIYYENEDDLEMQLVLAGRLKETDDCEDDLRN